MCEITILSLIKKKCRYQNTKCSHIIIKDIYLSSKHIAGSTLQLYWQWTIHKLNQKQINRKISFALAGLSSLYYDDNGYDYDDYDGNDRKDDNPEIKKKPHAFIS